MFLVVIVAVVTITVTAMVTMVFLLLFLLRLIETCEVGTIEKVLWLLRLTLFSVFLQRKRLLALFVHRYYLMCTCRSDSNEVGRDALVGRVCHETCEDILLEEVVLVIKSLKDDIL